MVAKLWSSQFHLPCPELGSRSSRSVRLPPLPHRRLSPSPTLVPLAFSVSVCVDVDAIKSGYVQRLEGSLRHQSSAVHLETGPLLFFTVCVRLAGSEAWEDPSVSTSHLPTGAGGCPGYVSRFYKSCGDSVSGPQTCTKFFCPPSLLPSPEVTIAIMVVTGDVY